MLPISVVFLLVSVISAAPSAAATLKVSSFPSGAQVIVDGVNTGKVTPMNISLPEGDHVVTVQIPGSGWNPDTRTVTIVSGNNDLSVTLLPTPTPGPPGPPGPPGATGQNGAGVSVFAEAPGANCPTGGVQVVSNTGIHYVCSGAEGPAGTATHAEPPCFDNVNRYVDCGNGTVTDTVTGLIWLQDAACMGLANYTAANQAAAALANGQCSLTDGSVAGDWRLPTKDEWSATIAHAVALSCTLSFGAYPSLTNDAGTACLSVGPSSFTGVLPNAFWSSTSLETDPILAWAARLLFGDIGDGSAKDGSRSVWPVRGGTR
jgi:hypothetical protein